MSYLSNRVATFHGRMGQVDPLTPRDLTTEERTQRARLILEEAVGELAVALIGTAETWAIVDEMIRKAIAKRGREPGDLAEIADAVIDTHVVCAGTLVTAGVQDKDLIDLVCDANDAKAGGGRDEHGKFQKPPGWQPPAIREELIRQGWKP
jgi:predicted HAD superfamily Cof-like phosphohydrolase